MVRPAHQRPKDVTAAASDDPEALAVELHSGKTATSNVNMLQAFVPCTRSVCVRRRLTVSGASLDRQPVFRLPKARFAVWRDDPGSPPTAAAGSAFAVL
jgi:hypothetical protein